MLERIETANHALGLNNEVFVCGKCEVKQSYTVSSARQVPVRYRGLSGSGAPKKPEAKRPD